VAEHNQFGREAEEIAVKYFIEHGYNILFRNWRHPPNEIDIIAIKNDMLHFIEVKARKTSAFGYPEESVGKKKIRGIMTAANEFLYQNQQYRHVQFDILSIVIPAGKEAEFFLIEDVYYYG
jgi:putative endonuclease